MVVPTSCGAGLSADRLLRLSGDVGAERVTLRLAFDACPAASRAVTVIVDEPVGTPTITDQLVVPAAVPVVPFAAQVTVVTPMSSDADPLTVMKSLVVLTTPLDGDVMAIKIGRAHV